MLKVFLPFFKTRPLDEIYLNPSSVVERLRPLEVFGCSLSLRSLELLRSESERSEREQPKGPKGLDFLVAQMRKLSVLKGLRSCRLKISSYCLAFAEA